MLSRFTLPVLVSSAVHAGLFSLTWPKEGVVVVLNDEPPPQRAFVLRPDPPEEIELVSSDVAKPKGSPDAGRPSSDEFISKEPAVFEMPPREPMTAGPVDVAKIRPGEWGDPVGVDDLSERVPVLSPGALDRAPQTRARVAPVYPNEARALGLTGEVWVEFVVDEAGRVIRPRVMRSTDERFESATLRAVEKWRFEPGTQKGQPVRFRMAVPVVFSLDA